jgi:hypothetical protein
MDLWVFWVIANGISNASGGKKFPKFEDRMAEAELDQ